MRVGSLVFATDQGLGYLAKSFFDAGVLTDVMVVAHGRRETHADWYPPGTAVITNLNDHRQRGEAERFAARMDVFLAFETPFLWSCFDEVRRAGGRAVLMPMYECTPTGLPSEPDLYLCPSVLDLDYFPTDKSVFVPVPVEDAFVDAARRRTLAETFVHNAGHGGLKGRNGTAEVLEAWNYVRSPARLIIRSQDPLPGAPSSRTEVFSPGDGRDGQTKEYVIGDCTRDRLYTDGDVFVFPEKFNGLSLPLQEAFASGMAVMATDRRPTNTWLPRGPLIPTAGTRRNRVSPRCLEFDEAVVDPRAIAAKVDEWYGRDVGELSDAGVEWGRRHTWTHLKDTYLRVLAGGKP